MADDRLSDAELDELEARIDGWLRTQLDENPIVAAVERGEAGERRWYVRVLGEEKSVFSIWFRLRQRTLSYETYVLPAPEEHRDEVLEMLLRRNRTLFGVAFAIGEEDAVFLVGQAPVGSLDEGEVDRILGTVYETVERTFKPALRLAFASKLGDGR